MQGQARTKVVKKSSPSPNTFPSINFEEFKCFICNKYLSVEPIFVCTDYQHCERNLCGRCIVPPEEYMAMVRNKTFEMLAKHFKFPCSASKNCKERLTWGEVDQHEKNCDFREVVCSLCHESHQVVNTMTHFRHNHPDNLFEMKNMTMSEAMLHRHSTQPITNLIVQPNLMCFVHLSVDATLSILDIRMQPVIPPTVPHVFNVIFSTRNNVIHYKNRPIKSEDNYDDLRCHEFEFNRIFELLMSDTTEFNVAVEIMEEGSSGGQSNDEVKVQNMARNIEEVTKELTRAVECDTCIEPARGDIYQCVTGHSICGNCRINVAQCPTCKKEYTGTRNYALEHVARLLTRLEVV